MKNQKSKQVQMEIGDKFTIAGFGIGSRGQLVIDGINPNTKRRCKAVKQAVYIVKKQIKGDPC